MWCYEGERLDERRSRMEREGSYGSYGTDAPAIDAEAGDLFDPVVGDKNIARQPFSI